MRDLFMELVADATSLVSSGYYDDVRELECSNRSGSLHAALRDCPFFPIIAEVKMASPAHPRLSRHRPERLISFYQEGGAAALSVLTEPNRFHGSLETLRLASTSGLPVLMKDFIVAEKQLEAGARVGASAVLLIERLSSLGMGHDLDALIEKAHSLGLEALLEISDDEEMLRGMHRDADILGINQRDLGSMEVNPRKGARLLQKFRSNSRVPIIVMSGIEQPSQMIELMAAGASGVLIGSSLSSSADPAAELAKYKVIK